MPTNNEYLKQTAEDQENRGDKALEERRFNDALRFFKNSIQQYKKITSAGLGNMDDIELKKMRIENKIREVEKAISQSKEQAAADNSSGSNKTPASSNKKPASSGGGNGRSAKEENKCNKDNKDKPFSVESSTGITFDHIVGLADAKQKITAALLPIRHPEKAARYNLKPGGFITLFGPPGTGKTTIARAITTEFDADLIVLKPSDILKAYVGQSEEKIAELFKQINESDRFTILYFDEGDTFFTRGSANEGYQARQLNEWKTQIDGFSGRANTLIILSCNDPEIIDPAILSRSTNIIYVPLPDEKDRKQIFEKKLEGMPLHSDVNLDVLAKKTHRYSGRKITTICENARRARFRKVIEAEEAGKNIIDAVCQEDLLEAIIETRPETSEKDIKRYEAIAERIASGGKV